MCQCNHDPGAFDSGRTVHNKCYCDEDQSSGYTYSDEYGPCLFCQGRFDVGQIVGSNIFNDPVVCDCHIGDLEVKFNA